MAKKLYQLSNIKSLNLKIIYDLYIFLLYFITSINFSFANEVLKFDDLVARDGLWYQKFKIY